jgi:hypothetical protein
VRFIAIGDIKSPLKRCLQAVRVTVEVQTLRERATMSRYTCTAYLVLNVNFYYKRMKKLQPSGDTIWKATRPAAMMGNCFTAVLLIISRRHSKEWQLYLLNKYHHIITPPAIKHAISVQCLVPSFNPLFWTLFFISLTFWGYGDRHFSQQNHKSSTSYFTVTFQQNIVYIASNTMHRKRQ